MNNSIPFEKVFHEVIIPSSIGSILWMKFISCFKQESSIIRTPDRSCFLELVQRVSLQNYLQNKFFPEFMEDTRIQKHKNYFETFAGDYDYSSVLNKLGKALFEKSKIFTDPDTFEEQRNVSIFPSAYETKKLLFPYLLKESIAMTLCMYPESNMEEVEILSIDGTGRYNGKNCVYGLYTLQKEDIVELSNPLSFSPVYLDQKVLADKKIIPILSLVTNTRAVETKCRIEFTTTKTNQVRFFRER
jgi:hypothetical protein